jgi:DNA-binding GntR family transcriptional regulator
MSHTEDQTTIVPVAKRMKLSDQVVETLSRLIIEGVLQPGSAIRTEELASQLGVSRTPTREALQRLEADGLVTASPNGVVRVATLEREQALELMDVREVVDGLACRILAERGTTEATFSELEELVASAEKASQANDKHGFLRFNARFHAAILTATNHRPLQQFHSLVRITSQAVYLRHGRQQLRHQQSSQEHAEILAALRLRDPVQAERAAKRHVRRAAQFWLRDVEKGRKIATDDA